MADDQQEQQERGPEWGMGTGWAVLATLISGMVVWGGIGALIDWWLDTNFGFPIGLVLGAAGGIYLIVKRYADFSTTADSSTEPEHDNTPGKSNNSTTEDSD